MTSRFLLVVFSGLLAIGCKDVMAHAYPLTPLASAARIGDIAAIERLVAAGEDINKGSGVNDWPPILHAVHKGQAAAVARLIEQGAVIDGSVGQQAIRMARDSGDAATEALLVAHGADSARPDPTASR